MKIKMENKHNDKINKSKNTKSKMEQNKNKRIK